MGRCWWLEASQTGLERNINTSYKSKSINFISAYLPLAMYFVISSIPYYGNGFLKAIFERSLACVVQKSFVPLASYCTIGYTE